MRCSGSGRSSIANFTNSVTPVMHGRTLIVSGNGEPTRALAIAKKANQWVTDVVWENADIPLRMSDAVVVGDVPVRVDDPQFGTILRR